MQQRYRRVLHIGIRQGIYGISRHRAKLLNRRLCYNSLFLSHLLRKQKYEHVCQFENERSVYFIRKPVFKEKLQEKFLRNVRKEVPKENRLSQGISKGRK